MNRIARRISRREQRVARGDSLRIAWMTDSHAWSVVDNQPDHPDAVLSTRYYYTVGDKIEQFVEQVNADQPHFVMHTGDFVERGRDFDFFLSKWGGLDAALPQAVVSGNHDHAFSPPSGSTVGETVAADMGYGASPLVAGSRFNRTYSLSGNGVTAKLIMMDTNIDPLTGKQSASNVGYLSDDMKTWIAAEVASSTADVILLASHHGAHMYDYGSASYFDVEDAHDLRDIVDAEVAARPSRKIRHLFGHHHIHSKVMEWGTLGPNLPGILAPATVELNPSAYINLLINARGDVGWEFHDTRYPNP